MRWLSRLFRNKPPAAPEEVGTGVLFGLDPPEGCQFKVDEGSDGDFWHVQIMRDGQAIGRGCESTKWCGSDRAAILRAAREAMGKADRKAARAELVGMYPPKRTP